MLVKTRVRYSLYADATVAEAVVRLGRREARQTWRHRGRPNGAMMRQAVRALRARLTRAAA